MAATMKYFGHILVDKHDVWKVDASGNFVSSIKAKLWEDEVKFGVDLNGDGDTGLVSVPKQTAMRILNMATIHTMAPHNTTSLTAVSAPIGLTNGGPKGPTSYAGWYVYPS